MGANDPKIDSTTVEGNIDANTARELCKVLQPLLELAGVDFEKKGIPGGQVSLSSFRLNNDGDFKIVLKNSGMCGFSMYDKDIGDHWKDIE